MRTGAGERLYRGLDGRIDPKWNREWLEQVITSNISPRIEGIEIRQFDLPNGNLVVCVHVPKSFRGPHQASDNKYYKRFQSASCAMEHYELDDVRARAQTIPPLVVLDMKPPPETCLQFVLRNVGTLPARNLKFKWSDKMEWPSGRPPAQFLRGITFLAPGKVLEIFNHGEKADLGLKVNGDDFKFDIEVSYQPGDS